MVIGLPATRRCQPTGRVRIPCQLSLRWRSRPRYQRALGNSPRCGVTIAAAQRLAPHLVTIADEVALAVDNQFGRLRHGRCRDPATKPIHRSHRSELAWAGAEPCDERAVTLSPRRTMIDPRKIAEPQATAYPATTSTHPTLDPVVRPELSHETTPELDSTLATLVRDLCRAIPDR